MIANQTLPNTTLYLKNLNDKIHKSELRAQLFALFMTYGKVIDVVALKGQKMRGQAFLVFTDLSEATAALRACEGMVFYDKPMHIEYARTKSYATLRQEDPNFIPKIYNAKSKQNGDGVIRNGLDKRPRENDEMDGMRQEKREKLDDDDGEEMELDDDDDANTATAKVAQSDFPPVMQPSTRLLCTNLPQEVTDDVLSVLFQQYQGFQSTLVSQAPNPNVSGVKVKMAQVFFDAPELASVAKDALDGFILKKGWKMNVVYI